MLTYFILFCTMNKVVKAVHLKCRGKYYLTDNIQRLVFPDELVPWKIPFLNYSPKEYNSPHLTGKPWADPPIDDSNFHPKWNTLDGNINRISYITQYILDDKGRPLNPCGRTGLRGRGMLGKWGPNHAADPIVTRWKRDSTGQQQFDHSGRYNQLIQFYIVNLRPILQVILIQRKDCNEWALPGGMVDPGELVSITLQREFIEEALNSLENNSIDTKMVEEFFENGEEIYKGYVDDPRNTDNAWMETIAVNFHDNDGEHVGKFSLEAGDDAKNVKWMDVTNELKLYANHAHFVEKTAQIHHAHWNPTI